jgi:hypothetical protein
MHPGGPIFFSFGEDEGVVGFIGFLSSQCVPQIIPQVLNTTSLYPISFALSSTHATYTSSPKGAVYNVSILRLSKTLINFLLLGQSPMYITKGKKLNFGGSPQLINTSQTYAIHHCTKDVQKHSQFSS